MTTRLDGYAISFSLCEARLSHQEKRHRYSVHEMGRSKKVKTSAGVTMTASFWTLVSVFVAPQSSCVTITVTGLRNYFKPSQMKSFYVFFNHSQESSLFTLITGQWPLCLQHL